MWGTLSYLSGWFYNVLPFIAALAICTLPAQRCWRQRTISYFVLLDDVFVSEDTDGVATPLLQNSTFDVFDRA